MDVETLSTLSRLLDEALELPPEQRAQWLSALPDEFQAFTPHLRSLLLRSAEVETDDFLRTVPKLSVPLTEGAAAAQAPSEAAGDTVGTYRLIKQLGSGGMASVWLAERTDGLLKRPVALKLPFGAWRRAGLAERMAREREILETLDHPNIARLLDAGLTEAGQPFLALEYVEGQPVDVYCREQALDLRSRIRLFIQIADAVAYAHAKLIVHRDLKPANVLVTPDGKAKLLDFGIAKLLEQGLARETRLTQFAGRALTPDYASPEQIAGEPISTASDVYSLGVLLYELLTGDRPYRLQRESRHALERAILEAEPLPPSERAADNTMRRALSGDLDTIVLKALRKQPAQRYATVNAFGEDLQRYLSGQPVLARPDGRWYRARKFIGRNKVAVGAAAAVFIAVVAGAGLTAWQARVAIAEQKRAEEVKEFIASIFRDASPYVSGGAAPSATDLLRQARSKLDQRLGDNPEVRVELLGILGTSLLSLNDIDSAEAVLQRAVADAERTLGRDHQAALHARVLLTTVDRFRGRTEEMARALEELLPRLRRQGPAGRESLVIALQNQAHQAIDQGQYELALAAAREARDLSIATHGLAHSQTIGCAIILATAHLFARDWAQALQAAQQASELAESVYRDNPRHPIAIESRATYAKALAASGDPATAVPMLTSAIEDLAAVFGETSKEVGFYTGELVLYQWRAGEIANAIRSSEKVVQVLGRYAEAGSYTHAAAHSLKGVSLLHARRGSEALPALEQAAESMRKALGETHPRHLNARANLLLASAYAGRVAAANRQIDELLAKLRTVDADSALTRSYYAAGVIRRLAGQPEAAIELQQQVLALLEDEPETRLERLEALAEIGIATEELGEHDSAVRQLETVRDSLQAMQTRMTPVQAEVLAALSRARLATGDEEGARALLLQVQRFQDEFDAQISPVSGSL